MTEQEICKVLEKFGAASAGCTTGFVCGVFPYYPPRVTPGNLSLYACGWDYHKWVKAALEQAADWLRQAVPGHQFTCYCDISPHDEVAIAHRCGLGVLGKNQLLITPDYGSYVFIGLIATDMPLTEKSNTKDCIGCMACVRQCPTGAIAEQGICVEQCLSHISQKRGELTEWEAAQVANSPLIWGCDLCQTVCPMNGGVKPSTVGQHITNLTAEELNGLSDRQFRRQYGEFAFAFRGIQPLLRNLKIQSKTE